MAMTFHVDISLTSTADPFRLRDFMQHISQRRQQIADMVSWCHAHVGRTKVKAARAQWGRGWRYKELRAWLIPLRTPRGRRWLAKRAQGSSKRLRFSFECAQVAMAFRFTFP